MSWLRVGSLLVTLVPLLVGACSRTSQSSSSADRGAQTGLTQLAEAPAVRRVWKGPSVDFEGRPSPNGRFMSTTDWSTGDLALRDLVADTTRRLTNKGSWSASADFAEGTVIAPDGRLVVFGWFSMDRARFELRASPISGADSGKVRTIFSAPDLDFPAPQSFTPDGRQVAAVLYREDRTIQIALIPLDGSPARILKSFGWQSPNNLAISPDGRWLAYDFPRDQMDPERDVYLMALDGSAESVALRDKGNDVVAGWTPDGSHLLVTSARGGTPGLWALPLVNGRTEGEPVLVRSDVWRMIPLGTSSDGSIFYGTQTGQRDLFTAAFDARRGRILSQPTSASGGAFNTSPYAVAFSADGQHIAYVVTRGSSTNPYGQSDLVIRSLERGTVQRLAPDLSRIVRVFWLPDGRSLLVRGSDAKGRAGLYRVTLESGAVTPVYQQTANFPNGVAITRDGSRAYFATTDNKAAVTTINVVDIATGAVRPVYSAPRGQLFGGIALSPDDREMAVALRPVAAGISTILVVPANDGAARELYRFSPPEQLSAYANIAWSPDGEFVYFAARTNERPDAIPPSMEMRRIPAAGGKAETIALNAGFTTAFQISPDGGRIAYGVDEFAGEVWIMSPPKLSSMVKAADRNR